MVETMTEGQCQTVQWVMVSTKWPLFKVQFGKILSFCDLAKRSRKCQGQKNRSCAQLHHHSWNHMGRSKSNSTMSYGCPQNSVFDGRLVLPGPYWHTPGDKIIIPAPINLSNVYIYIYIYIYNCIPRTKYVRGILWFSRRSAAASASAASAASADTSSFSR